MHKKMGKYFQYLGRKTKQLGRSIILTAVIISGSVLASELMSFLGAPRDASVFVCLISVILVSRIVPGRLYGIIAAVLGTLLYFLLLGEPRSSPDFTARLLIMLITMIAVSLIVSAVTETMRTHTLLAAEHERRLQTLYELSRELPGAHSSIRIIQLAATHIHEYIKVPLVFYRSDPLTGAAPSLVFGQSESSTPLINSVEVKEHVHQLFASEKPELSVLELAGSEKIISIPLEASGKTIGSVCLICGIRALTKDEMAYIHTVLDQAVPVLELQGMRDQQLKKQLMHEREQARSTLLRSISHDLRTPLTSISGASSTLLEQKDLDQSTREMLLRDINETAEWLTRMVENILTITRITEGTLKVEKSREPLEEVLSHSASIVRKQYPNCHIHIDIPDELVLVPMDSTLISQVTINLLANAVKNSPGGGLVLLTLSSNDQYATVEVSDNGAGISPDMLDKLFDRYTQARAADGSRSTGIGLSICQTIIHAHGGVIQGRNRTHGGAIFTYSLPLKAAGVEPVPPDSGSFRSF